MPKSHITRARRRKILRHSQEHITDIQDVMDWFRRDSSKGRPVDELMHARSVFGALIEAMHVIQDGGLPAYASRAGRLIEEAKDVMSEANELIEKLRIEYINAQNN